MPMTRPHPPPLRHFEKRFGDVSWHISNYPKHIFKAKNSLESYFYFLRLSLFFEVIFYLRKYT